MIELAPILVLVWAVAVVAAFPSFSRLHRAVLFAFLSGTLFLPEALPAHIAIGPFHLTKYHAINYAALFGSLLFDSKRLFAFDPRLIDLPALVWCVCPIVSGLTNDPPPDGSSALRDALAQTWSQTVSYGIPYLLGRVYFADRAALRDLVLGVVIGAFVYIPLCFYELWMSPQLHNIFYGYAQHSFAQTIRFGGYRPMVFFSHGLALAMFMVAASLFAVWNRRSLVLSATGQSDGTPMGGGVGLLVLLVTTVLLKSSGAIALGIVGGGVLSLGRATGSRVWLGLLVALPLIYVGTRSTGTWTGDNLVQFISSNFDADRAGSLEFRFINENILVTRALERPLFGWGGWGRNRVIDEESGKDISTTDGLWIIILGINGFVGLVAFGCMLLVPIVRFMYLESPSQWATPGLAPVAGCAVVLALWTIDSLVNAMVVPMYFVIAGGLSAVSEPVTEVEGLPA